MLQACRNCHSQFDNTKQRSNCPHKDFPKLCIEHDRYNCGMPKCEREGLIKLRKDEVA